MSDIALRSGPRCGEVYADTSEVTLRTNIVLADDLVEEAFRHTRHVRPLKVVHVGS